MFPAADNKMVATVNQKNKVSFKKLSERDTVRFVGAVRSGGVSVAHYIK